MDSLGQDAFESLVEPCFIAKLQSLPVAFLQYRRKHYPRLAAVLDALRDGRVNVELPATAAVVALPPLGAAHALAPASWGAAGAVPVDPRPYAAGSLAGVFERFLRACHSL